MHPCVKQREWIHCPKTCLTMQGQGLRSQPVRLAIFHFVPMQHPLFLLPRLAFCTLVLWATAASAQAPTVYKWTDAQGLVHYSERPPAQAGQRPMPMNIKAPAPSAAQPASAAAKAPDAFAEAFKRQAAKSPEKPPSAPTARPRVVAESNGTEDGSDASRCALARDILKGALRHANGAKIDQYDLDTARNDVRMFCKNR